MWVAFVVLAAAARVALVGEPRKPISHNEAAVGVLTLPLTIWFIVWISSQAQ